MSVNRSHPIVHLPLLLLGILFALPFCWLLATALQPREQAMSVPPQWLPRIHVLSLGDERIPVTPPEPVTVDLVEVRLTAGPHADEVRILPATTYADGRATIAVRQADRSVPTPTAAELVRQIPVGWVTVREWHASKFIEGDPRYFHVPAAQVSSHVSPVWRNYPEAIRALTGSISDKKRPLGELMTASRLPWHADGSSRPVTFLTYLANTCVVAILGVIGTVLSSSLAAYGLARLQWKGQKTLFTVTLATMMIPFPVLMVPLYAVFRELGWIGTLMPLWVPAWFGSAFNIFLLRQFFLTIPGELSDAARVDGAGEFRIWWSIILPLARPALAVVALFHFLYAWNDFLGPLLFLTEPGDFTLALGLQQYQSQGGGSEWHLLMAASVLLMVPIIVLFILAQKTFIQGIATTGGK